MKLVLPPSVNILDVERPSLPIDKLDFEQVRSFSFSEVTPSVYIPLLENMTNLEHLSVMVEPMTEMRGPNGGTFKVYGPQQLQDLIASRQSLKSLDLGVKDMTLDEVFSEKYRRIDLVKVNLPRLVVHEKDFKIEGDSFVLTGPNRTSKCLSSSCKRLTSVFYISD